MATEQITQHRKNILRMPPLIVMNCRPNYWCIGGSLWGMHFFWWLFWVAAVVLMFSPMTPVSPGRRRETPLRLLQCRYATGEVSALEYEERRDILERDIKVLK